jgi:hypothetical protein
MYLFHPTVSLRVGGGSPPTRLPPPDEHSLSFVDCWIREWPTSPDVNFGVGKAHVLYHLRGSRLEVDVRDMAGIPSRTATLCPTFRSGAESATTRGDSSCRARERMFRLSRWPNVAF